MLLIALTIVALVMATVMQMIVGVATIKAVALFLGLEGTILLASALSPSHDELKVARQSGALDGDKFQTTVRYNRLFFYGGFGLLAASFVLSAIPG